MKLSNSLGHNRFAVQTLQWSLEFLIQNRSWPRRHLNYSFSNSCSKVLSLLQAVEGVLETMLPADTEMALRYKDCHLIVLRGFQDPRGYGPLWTARQVLKVLADLPPEVRYNFEGIDILCRAHLITMREFDHLLAQVGLLRFYPGVSKDIVWLGFFENLVTVIS